MPDAGGARMTIGASFAGADVGNGYMDDCVIEGIEGVDVATAAVGTIFKTSTLIATALALDDNSDDVMCLDMNFISDAAAGAATATGCLDWNPRKSAGCYLTAAATDGPIPNLTAHA